MLKMNDSRLVLEVRFCGSQDNIKSLIETVDDWAKRNGYQLDIRSFRPVYYSDTQKHFNVDRLYARWVKTAVIQEKSESNSIHKNFLRHEH